MFTEGDDRCMEDTVGVHKPEKAFKKIFEEHGTVSERFLRLREVEYVGEGFLY